MVLIMALLCQWCILKCSCYSHQKTAVELTKDKYITMHFKVTTSNYLSHDSKF